MAPTRRNTDPASMPPFSPGKRRSADLRPYFLVISRRIATRDGWMGTMRVSPSPLPSRSRSSWTSPVSVHWLPTSGRVRGRGTRPTPSPAAWHRPRGGRPLPPTRGRVVQRGLRGAARARLSRHGGSVKLATADLREKLPLEGASVDAVVSSNLLECLPDPTLLLREVHRVLRPGGRMVLSRSDFDSLTRREGPCGRARRVRLSYLAGSPGRRSPRPSRLRATRHR